MAAIMPNIPGTGNNIPISNYVAGITESYPNVNRQRTVESSINSKETIDFLPSNIGVNQSISDKYLEYRINGTVGSFLDLSSIIMELQLKPQNAVDGSNLTDEDVITFVNGLSNTIFKSVTVFINDKMVESNPFFNYSSYVKLLKQLDKTQVDRYGSCGFFYDNYNTGGVTSRYTVDTFKAKPANLETHLLNKVKRGKTCLCFPLLLDISTMDMYLLDGVDVRIRLELANQDWIIKSSKQNPQLAINISKAKLWVDKVTPHHNAMTALNHAMNTKPVEYIFNKTLFKTFVIGNGESSIMIDQPFGNCIPEKLTMLLVDMRSMAGDPTLNPLYFKHCDLANTHVTINGSTIYNINTDFNNDNYAHMFYECQKSIGIESNNMITADSFSKGRSVFCFNFVNEVTEDSLPIERSANLRLSLTLDNNLTSPHVVILLADTKGIISIDNQRIVTCDVRG